MLADFVPSVYDGDTLGKELSELEGYFLAQAGAKMFRCLEPAHREVEFETGQSCAVCKASTGWRVDWIIQRLRRPASADRRRRLLRVLE